jgi:hypothetical protein
MLHQLFVPRIPLPGDGTRRRLAVRHLL